MRHLLMTAVAVALATTLGVPIGAAEAAPGGLASPGVPAADAEYYRQHPSNRHTPRAPHGRGDGETRAHGYEPQTRWSY
jgi:hypothetical protein